MSDRDLGSDPPSGQPLAQAGAPKPARGQAGEPASAEPVASILLVDDYRPNLIALEAVLAPLGQRLVTAQSGEEALEHLGRGEFALILLDVNMRGLDGFETAERIKGIEKSRRTPIIFITGMPEDESRLYRGYERGAVDYVLKPFNPYILCAKVSVFVELYRKTEQVKRQEAEVRRLERETSDEVFRRIMDTTMMGLLFSDYEGRVLDANSAFLSMIGYSREDLLAGRINWEVLSAPEYQAITRDAIRKLSAHGASRQIEKEYLRKDGTRISVLVGSARIERQQRNITYVLDITERKRAEANVTLLAEAGKLLSSSLDFTETLRQLARIAVPVLADWCAADMREPDGSPRRIITLCEDPRRVAIADELLQRYPDDPDATYGVPNVLRTGETEWGYDIPDALLVANAKDEEHVRLMREIGMRSYMIVPLAARGRVLGALTLVQAESGRRYTESDVRFTEELARRAALSVDNALLFEQEVRARKEIQTLADELRRSEEEFRLLAETMPQLVWTARPDGRYDYFNQRWYEYTGISLEEASREDGWGRLVHPDERETSLEAWTRSLQTGEPYEMQYRLLRVSDGTYRWFIGRALAARDASGHIQRWFGTCTDIDDQKRAEEERQRLVEALERSNKELDQFAYVTSHDLKAPLRGIANLSQWIEEDLSEKMSAENKNQMELLRGRVHRLESLIDGILSYARAGRARGKPEAVDVGALLRDIAELLAPPAGARIEIAPDMPFLYTERVPLQQTFLNLISNALKHAGRADPVVRIQGQDAGAFWEFSVTDNGPGIAPEYHDRIWGIFQTLKPRDEVEGTGATFRFTWPKGFDPNQTLRPA